MPLSIGMMSQLSRRVVAAAVADYGFSAVSRVLDVGGGLGHFVSAVLTAYPELEGAVFDVPEVAEKAGNYLRHTDLADRCIAAGGSFFESLPAGFDVLLLKWILRDWNDESCRKLLKVCRAALPDHGRLLVVERLLPKEISTSIPLNPAIAMDLGMLVNFGDAWERYLKECEELPACQLPTGSCPVHEPECQLVNHVALVQLDSVDTEPMDACNALTAPSEGVRREHVNGSIGPPG